MRHLIDATRQGVAQGNWYATLALALTMPDICGRITFPELKGPGKSRERVVAWFDKYLAHRYQAGVSRRQTMAGGDFYALRCAYLHQGDFSLEEHKAREILTRFYLSIPGTNFIHNNFSENVDAQGNVTNAVLQLSVDRLCEEVCSAVESWLADVQPDARIQAEIKELGTLVQEGAIR